MSTHDETTLSNACKVLQRSVHELNLQALSLEQRLAAKKLETTVNDCIATDGIAAIVEAMIPAIRKIIREELNALKPLDEAWYYPSEVEAISCGKVTARTLRDWLRWGQIDGESDGNQVRIYLSTVEELRKNKWRPLREPDPCKLPPSKRPKCLLNQSVAQ